MAGSPIEPDLSRRNAMSRAATLREALENEIAAGILRAGDRLDEVQLATRFNVSRTPVREALHQLASSGLIELRPHRGAVVARVAPDRLVGCVRRDGGARRDVRAPCGPPPDGCGPGSASEGAPELREGSDDEGRGPLLLRERTVPPRALPGQPEPVSCRRGDPPSQPAQAVSTAAASHERADRNLDRRARAGPSPPFLTATDPAPKSALGRISSCRASASPI